MTNRERRAKSVTFSIVVTYESNEDSDRDGLTLMVGDGCMTIDYGRTFNAILQVVDEVIRQQSAELLGSVPTRFARVFATRKVKLFGQTVPRQPQKILYDERKNGTREFPQPHWRVLPKWQKDRVGLGQKS